MTKWTGGSGSALARRACPAVVVPLLAGLLAGCIVIPAKAKVAQSGDVQVSSGGIALSVLFSHDFSPETPKSLGRKMVECVTRGLAEAEPEVRLVSEEEFHRAVFGVKPGEVLLRADTIGKLLARPDIRQRVGVSGLTHLILVGGATHHHSGKSFIRGYGGPGGAIVVGSADVTRSTELTASIFELASATEVGGVQASAEGHQGGVMILPFLLGWVHATQSSSCEALGAEVARAIRGKPRDESR